MRNLKSGIYLITNIINHKEYNGKSKNLKDREYNHWYKLKRGNHANPHLQNAYNKYGKKSLHFAILEYVDVRDKKRDPKGYEEDLKYLEQREIWWTDLLGCMHPKGYVLKKGGGVEFSEETKKKLSNIAKEKGYKPPSGSWVGRKHRVETIRKLSIIATGRKQSAETIQKRVSKFKGQYWKVVSPEGEDILIRNLARFCRDMGLDVEKMYRVSKGTYAQHRGWKVRRVEKENG